jgi:6-phosphogluconolactonase/glucosamine-6-phosphate isomerase/deaminase
MEIIYEPDNLTLLQLAAKAIDKELKQLKGEPALLLLSGGSSLEVMDYISTKHFGQNITIAFVDERWSKTPADLNLTSFLESDFYHKIKNRRLDILNIKTEGTKSFKVSAKLFEKELENWFLDTPKGKAIGIFGVGCDGHTAGVMPYPEKQKWFNNAFVGKSWVIGYDATGKNPLAERISVTLSFIKKKIRTAFVYITGEEKRGALARLIADKGILAETPARIYRGIQRSIIFTDILIN